MCKRMDGGSFDCLDLSNFLALCLLCWKGEGGTNSCSNRSDQLNSIGKCESVGMQVISINTPSQSLIIIYPPIVI